MAAPLRIAFVITELEVGGAERCLVNLATGLDASQFEPVVYSLGPRPRAGREQLVTQLEAAGVPMHFLGLTHWSQFFRGVRALTELLQKQRPDIVQTFLFHANVLGTRAARRAGVPHVCTGVRVADPRWTRGLVEQRATRGVSRIVCVSEGVAAQCRRRGFPAEKLVVIPNGIDVERWKNAQPADLTQFGVPAGKRVFVFVGRLDRQKGILDLIVHGLIGVAMEENEEHDFLVVGDGPMRDVLLKTAKATPIVRRIHFAGWHHDIPAIMAAADLLVLFSRWEGMPNVILEAMATGKPVLTIPVEGAEELFGDASSEQTARRDYPERLAELVRNVHLRNDLGRRNQLRAEQEFSLSRMIGRYADLYESLARNEV